MPDLVSWLSSLVPSQARLLAQAGKAFDSLYLPPTYDNVWTSDQPCSQPGEQWYSGGGRLCPSLVCDILWALTGLPCALKVNLFRRLIFCEPCILMSGISLLGKISSKSQHYSSGRCFPTNCDEPPEMYWSQMLMERQKGIVLPHWWKMPVCALFSGRALYVSESGNKPCQCVGRGMTPTPWAGGRRHLVLLLFPAPYVDRNIEGQACAFITRQWKRQAEQWQITEELILPASNMNIWWLDYREPLLLKIPNVVLLCKLLYIYDDILCIVSNLPYYYP